MIIALPHTGWWWLDVLICVVSGVSFVALCILIPRLYRENRALLEFYLPRKVQEWLDKRR